MASRQNTNDPDWAEQVPWTRPHGPYRSYGWEAGESDLPEFRDPSVHVMPQERKRVSRWRNIGQQQVEGPYIGIGPRNYQRPDERIHDDVCERLTQHGLIDASHISVEVHQRQVTLTGTVPDRRMKRMAEDVAESVSGVEDIHNQLRLDNTARGAGQSQRQGQGRVDRVGRSGVYPASGPLPPGDAEVQGMASWGQGERGAEGYYDHGESELHVTRPDQENQ